MTAKRALSRRTGEFVLALLEQPRPGIIGSVLEDIDQAVAEDLRTTGILQPASVFPSTQIVNDDGVSMVDLTWASDLDTLTSVPPMAG